MTSCAEEDQGSAFQTRGEHPTRLEAIVALHSLPFESTKRLLMEVILDLASSGAAIPSSALVLMRAYHPELYEELTSAIDAAVRRERIEAALAVHGSIDDETEKHLRRTMLESRSSWR